MASTGLTNHAFPVRMLFITQHGIGALAGVDDLPAESKPGTTAYRFVLHDPVVPVPQNVRGRAFGS